MAMAMDPSTTLVERILSAYKQALLYILVTIAYSIIAIIVMVIGFSMFDSSIFLGVIVMVIGFFLLVTSVWAAFLFSATRGTGDLKPLGFIDAYVQTIKLIGELALAIFVAVVFLIIGFSLEGAIAVIFIFLGFMTILLFPTAALFYVVNFISSQ